MYVSMQWYILGEIHLYLVHECTINWILLYTFAYTLYKIRYKRQRIKHVRIIRFIRLNISYITFNSWMIKKFARRIFFNAKKRKRRKKNKSFYYAISVSPYYIRVLRRARIKRHFAIRDIVRFIFEVVKTGEEGGRGGGWRSVEMLEVKYWKFERNFLPATIRTHFSVF